MAFRFAIPWRSGNVVTSGDGRRAPVPVRRGNVAPARARSYGYRSTAQQPPSGNDPGVTTPLPRRGAQADTTSSPASTRRIDGDALAPVSAGQRSYLAHTEDDLNTGPVPNRIDRGTTARNAGKIGVGAYPAGIAGWPYDGNAMFIPHLVIPRRPITVTPFQRTIDTSVTVSAPAIGGPLS